MAYATIEDVRGEGIEDPPADDVIQTSIDTWTAFIERVTRQFFEPRTATVDLDGQDSHTLHLPVPIISVTSLFANGDFVNAVPTSKYVVYNGRGAPADDRQNPRIKLVQSVDNIFHVGHRSRFGTVFLRGMKNQRIVGSWGYTESDGSTPKLIKRALLKLVVRDLLAQGSVGLSASVETPGAPGAVMSETTDGHTIMYVNPLNKLTRPGTNAVTGDAEVDHILSQYRAPIGMAVPGSDSWFMG